jgi:hypothetical protein
MQMTEAFGSAVAVSVPIFALAAGAEARGVRDRLRRPDQRWEQDFAAYRAENELDLSGRPSEVFSYFKGIPGLSKLYVLERVLALASAVAWLVVFVLLGITELRCLAWLADGAQPGNPGLASFALVSIGLAMLALIVAPTLYLLVPLAMPLDVIPQGLKKTVAPKLSGAKGREFFKLAFQELEGAMNRAGDKWEASQQQTTANQPETAQQPESNPASSEQPTPAGLPTPAQPQVSSEQPTPAGQPTPADR